MESRVEALARAVVEALRGVHARDKLVGYVRSVGRVSHPTTAGIARAFVNSRDAELKAVACTMLFASGTPQDRAAAVRVLLESDESVLVWFMNGFHWWHWSRSLKPDAFPELLLRRFIDALDRFRGSTGFLTGAARGVLPFAAGSSLEGALRQTLIRAYDRSTKPESSKDLARTVPDAGTNWNPYRFIYELWGDEPIRTLWGDEPIQMIPPEAVAGPEAARRFALANLDPRNPQYGIALAILAQRPTPNLEPMFADLLASADYKMFRVAANALGALQTPSARDRLLAAARNPDDVQSPSIIFEQLNRYPDASVTQAITAAARKGKDDYRTWAIHFLAKREGSEVGEALVGLAAKGRSRVRAAAMDALAERREVGAIPVLREALEDSNDDVFAHAVAALLALRAWDAIPPIEGQLQRLQGQFVRLDVPEDPGAPTEVLLALSFLGWNFPEDKPPLVARVVDRVRDPEVRERARRIGSASRWTGFSGLSVDERDVVAVAIRDYVQAVMNDYIALLVALSYSRGLREEALLVQILDFFTQGTAPSDPSKLALVLIDYPEASGRNASLFSKDHLKAADAFVSRWLKTCDVAGLQAAFPAIVHALESPSTRVVKPATKYLKIIGKRDVKALLPTLDFLVELAFHESAAVASEALAIVRTALVKGGVDPSVVLPKLTPLLDSDRGAVKGGFLRILGELGTEVLRNEADLGQRLQEVASSPRDTEEVRSAAAALLRGLGIPVVPVNRVARIVASAAHPNARVRKQAARDFALLESPPPISEIASCFRGLFVKLPDNLYQGDREEHPLETFSSALGDLPAPRRSAWAAALLNLWWSPLDLAAREPLALVLALLREPSAVPALVSALAYAPPEKSSPGTGFAWSETEEYLRDALRRMPRAAVPSILGTLPVAASPHRARLLDVLADVDPAEFRRVSASFLDPRDPVVRRSVLEAMFRLRKDVTDELVIACLRDPDEAIRRLAAIRAKDRPRPLYIASIRAALSMAPTMESLPELFFALEANEALTAEDVVRLLRDERLTREARTWVAERSWKVDTPETARALVDAIVRDPRLAWPIGTSLVQMKQPLGLLEYLERVPDPGEPNARGTATRLAAQIDPSQARAVLSSVAAHPDPERRLLAVYVASRARVPLDESLRDRLRQDPDERIRGTAGHLAFT